MDLIIIFIFSPHDMFYYNKRTRFLFFLGDGDYNEDVAQSIQLLLQFVPLIDLMDSPASSNCIEAILTELVKLKLLNEKQVLAYNQRYLI